MGACCSSSSSRAASGKDSSGSASPDARDLKAGNAGSSPGSTEKFSFGSGRLRKVVRFDMMPNPSGNVHGSNDPDKESRDAADESNNATGGADGLEDEESSGLVALGPSDPAVPPGLDRAAAGRRGSDGENDQLYLSVAQRHVNAKNHVTGFRRPGQGNVKISRAQYDDGDVPSPTHYEV